MSTSTTTESTALFTLAVDALRAEEWQRVTVWQRFAADWRAAIAGAVDAARADYPTDRLRVRLTDEAEWDDWFAELTSGEPAPREIPAGRVLLAEGYGVDDSNRARVTELERRDAKGRTYRLVRSSAGFEPAGSAARWTNGYYAVWFMVGGARNGRRFVTLADARAMFERWTSGEGE